MSTIKKRVSGVLFLVFLFTCIPQTSLSAGSVKEDILKQYPNTLEIKDPLKKSLVLLKWTVNAVNLDWGWKGKTNLKLTADEIYNNHFKKDKGFVCGGMAVFFEKVLGELGVPEAFTINIGITGKGATHVTVVVPVKHKNSLKFFIFDPLTGGYYINKKGDFVDIESILAGKPFEFKAVPMARTTMISPGSLKFFIDNKFPGVENAICDYDSPLPSGFIRCENFYYSKEMLQRMRIPLEEIGVSMDGDIITQLIRINILNFWNVNKKTVAQFEQMVARHNNN